MKCCNFEDLIQLSIDGQIRKEQQSALDAHLATCPDCAALLADMQAIHSILSTELSAVEPPPDFVAATMAKLPAAHKKPKALRLWRPKLIFGLGSFAACAAAVLFMVFGGSIQPEQPLIAEDNQPNQALISQADPQSNTITVPEDRPADQPIENIEPLIIDPSAANALDANAATEAEPPLLGAEPNQPSEAAGEQGSSEQAEQTEQGSNEPTEQDAEPIAAQAQLAAGEPAAITANPDAEPEMVHGVLEIPQPAHQQIIIPVDVFVPKLFAAFDCDAILPHIDENGLVNYYTNYRGYYQKWQQELISEAESVYIENSNSLPDMPTLLGYSNYDDGVNQPLSYALSPDNSLLAVNNGGDVHNGVWLFNNEPIALDQQNPAAAGEQPSDSLPEGSEPLTDDANLAQAGDSAEQQAQPDSTIDIAELNFSLGTAVFINQASGELLNWSPNGSKLLFTDSEGLLYVYYAYYGGEQRYYQLSQTPVTSADWSADSRMVLFSSQQEGDLHSNIYMVMVP